MKSLLIGLTLLAGASLCAEAVPVRYIQSRDTLQSGTTIYVASGTVSNLNSSCLKFNENVTAAGTGCYGQVVSSESLGGFVSNGATTVWVNYLQIDLQPGQYLIDGMLIFNTGSGTVVTSVSAAISAYSGNTTTDHVIGKNVASATGAFLSAAGVIFPLNVNSYKVLITVPTTFYLKGTATYGSGSGGNMRWGIISAIKIR